MNDRKHKLEIITNQHTTTVIQFLENQLKEFSIFWKSQDLLFQCFLLDTFEGFFSTRLKGSFYLEDLTIIIINLNFF